METPNYYAIIPAEIRYCKELSMFQKLLYAEITALTQKDGYCWASNKYFAELYEMSDRYISQSINALKEKGFLQVEIDKENGNKRKIYIGKIRRVSGKTVSSIPMEQKCETYGTKVLDPYGTKVPQNNININNINNNKKNNNNSNELLLQKKEKIIVKEDNFLEIVNKYISTEFIKNLKNQYQLDGENIKKSCREFCEYWTEKSPAGKKQRWQMEKVFDVRRRLKTWFENEKKFNENSFLKKNITNNRIG